jgi:hypothetical protein
MGKLGVAGRCGRRKIRTTWRDPGAKPASDLVDRDFSADEWKSQVEIAPL